MCSLLTPVFVDADRLLMPSFSTAKVRDMFDDMADICEQMITKWERCVRERVSAGRERLTRCRFGPRATIDPVEDFTRLAFDTITLCAMNYRCAPPFCRPLVDPSLIAPARRLNNFYKVRTRPSRGVGRR